MELARHGNLIEAGVLFGIARVLVAHEWHSPKRRRPPLLVFVITLILFGLSDLVESRTGAWGTP